MCDQKRDCLGIQKISKSGIFELNFNSVWLEASYPVEKGVPR